MKIDFKGISQKIVRNDINPFWQKAVSRASIMWHVEQDMPNTKALLSSSKRSLIFQIKASAINRSVNTTLVGELHTYWEMKFSQHEVFIFPAKQP